MEKPSTKSNQSPISGTIPKQLKQRVDAICEKLGLRKSAFWQYAIDLAVNSIEKNGMSLPASGKPQSDQ